MAWKKYNAKFSEFRVISRFFNVRFTFPRFLQFNNKKNRFLKSNQQLTDESDNGRMSDSSCPIQKKESDFIKRLLQLKGDESVSSFSRRCGINESVLRGYIKNGNKPGLDHLVAIADAGNVSIEWLATGRGSKQRNAAVNHGSVVVNGGSMAIGNGNTVHSTGKAVNLEQLTKALEITGADPTHAKVVTAVYDLLQSGAPLPQIANLVRVMMPK